LRPQALTAAAEAALTAGSYKDAAKQKAHRLVIGFMSYNSSRH